MNAEWASIRARVVSAGDEWPGELQRAGELTPYAAETICDDALRAGPGARLEITVAAGTDDVEQVAGVGHRYLGREFTHHLRRRRDLADGFFLDPQAHDQCCHHWRRHFASHDLAEQRQHFIVENFAVFDAAQQRFLWGDRHDMSWCGLLWLIGGSVA